MSEAIATRDLKRLCDVGLLTPIGEKRGRYYVAQAALLEIADRTREAGRAADPYEIVARREAEQQLDLSLR